MKTLDRYILRNFLASTMLWFVVFMALRTVADLFINMDEFAKLGMPFGRLVGYVGTYYGYQSLAYFTELGGVIIVASAAFTLAMMNHTNELTAMLASGVSLHRVVAPIIGCSMALSGLIVLDQELLIPRVAPHLVRERDDVMGQNLFQVRLMPDGNGSIWFATSFDPTQQVMHSPLVIVMGPGNQAVARISGRQAWPQTLRGQAGWVFTDGVLSRMDNTGRPWRTVPRWNAVSSSLTPGSLAGSFDPNCGLEAVDPAYGLTILADGLEADPASPEGAGAVLRRPQFDFRNEAGRMLGAFVASSAVWTAAGRGEGYWALNEGVLFFPSDLTVEDLALRRSESWLQYMSASQLTRLLRLKRVPDVRAALLTLHVRFTDPLNNLIMLLLGLPFILSRERNIRSSTALCLLMVGTFYVFIYFCRYLGLPPTWAAWLPILIFGPIAAVMLDSVKT